MARDPQDRYKDAKELTDEISRFLSGGLVQAYEYRFGELLRRFIKKHRTFLVTAGISLMVLIAVSVYSYFQVVAQRNEAVRQRGIADEKRIEADEQRGIAEEQRDLAEEAPRPGGNRQGRSPTRTLFVQHRLGRA